MPEASSGPAGAFNRLVNVVVVAAGSAVFNFPP